MKRQVDDFLLLFFVSLIVAVSSSSPSTSTSYNTHSWQFLFSSLKS